MNAGTGICSALTTRTQLPRPVTPNNSLNPRRATAGSVSLVRASRTIVAYQAYAARLRARG